MCDGVVVSAPISQRAAPGLNTFNILDGAFIFSSFMCGFLWELWAPPTVQKHDCRLTDYVVP